MTEWEDTPDYYPPNEDYMNEDEEDFDFDEVEEKERRISYPRRLELNRLAERLASLMIDDTVDNEERHFVCEHMKFMVLDLPPEKDMEE